MDRFLLEEAIKNKSFVIRPGVDVKEVDLEDYKKICSNYFMLNNCEELTIYNMDDKNNLLSKDFKNLKLLQMSGCELIKLKSLEKLKKLKYLIIKYLHHNTNDNNGQNIKYDTELPLINKLEHLEINSLYFNINIPSYKNLKSLIIENIYDNLTLNDNLKSLYYLKIENSNLLNIPNTYINLKILELDNINNLKELPDTLINLERLTIKNCKNLNYLPETLINLKYLTLNVLSKLKIKYIPKTYTNLEYFNFSCDNYFGEEDILINLCIQIKENSNFNKFKNNFLFLPYEVFENLKVFNYYNFKNNFTIDLNNFKKLVEDNLYINNNFLII